MTIPTLKRVKITSERELRDWLAKQPTGAQEIMLVTFSTSSSDKYVSREQVGTALAEFGWEAGRRYTLNATLIGHVISKAAGDVAAE